MGQVLLLRIVRERWSVARGKFEQMDTRPVDPEPTIQLRVGVPLEIGDGVQLAVQIGGGWGAGSGLGV